MENMKIHAHPHLWQFPEGKNEEMLHEEIGAVHFSDTWQDTHTLWAGRCKTKSHEHILMIVADWGQLSRTFTIQRLKDTLDS